MGEARTRPESADEFMEFSFTGAEIAECLSEAIWENERAPKTSVWFSFWDRLTQGGPLPDMSSREEG